MEQMIRMRATARQLYDGRALRHGDEFVAPESAADDLVAISFAERIGPVVQTKVAVADSQLQPSAAAVEANADAPVVASTPEAKAPDEKAGEVSGESDDAGPAQQKIRRNRYATRQMTAEG